jgi:hypothetical protein
MLLALRSLWEEQAGADVIVEGEGVAANPQVGTGSFLITRGTAGGARKRPRKPRQRDRGYWVPMRMPIPADVVVFGEGVWAKPQIGIGVVRTEIDLSDDEILAILMMAAEKPALRVSRDDKYIHLSESDAHVLMRAIGEAIRDSGGALDHEDQAREPIADLAAA